MNQFTAQSKQTQSSEGGRKLEMVCCVKQGTKPVRAPKNFVNT